MINQDTYREMLARSLLSKRRQNHVFKSWLILYAKIGDSPCK